jgi:GNAT superfamily N-acetyltransferase
LAPERCQIIPGLGCSQNAAVAVDWMQLALDLRGEERPAADVPGIAVTSLETWGDTAEHRRAVYELNRTCSADIPERGEFFGYAEWEQLRLESPGTRFDGVVLALAIDLALDGAVPVGLCQLTAPPGRGWAFVEMTGVLRAYRRRGVAAAMKARAFAAARGWGCTQVRTFHHPANLPAISANLALGFRASSSLSDDGPSADEARGT